MKAKEIYQYIIERGFDLSVFMNQNELIKGIQSAFPCNYNTAYRVAKMLGNW